MSKIDFLKISKTPKIFVGCSDLTALLTCFNSKSKITTFHGPVLQGLIDKDCPQFTWDSLFSQLSGDDSALGSICHNYNLKDKTVEVLFKGKATGQLIGGNLAVLCSLLGTSFFPKLDGKILLFEDIGELPFRLDRALTQLTNAGVLNKVAGFALGLFKDCEYRAPKEGELVEKKQSVNDVFCERLKQFRKPIISGLPFGHLPHNATLPIGSLVTLDGGRGDLIIEEIGVNRQRGSHPQR